MFESAHHFDLGSLYSNSNGAIFKVGNLVLQQPVSAERDSS